MVELYHDSSHTFAADMPIRIGDVTTVAVQELRDGERIGEAEKIEISSDGFDEFS